MTHPASDLVERLHTLNWRDPVPDDLQSEVRMRFNEALAGGPNMNGDAGPTLTPNHAYDCMLAVERIDGLTDHITELEAEVARLREERSFVWKWVERAMFDETIGKGAALATLAFYPDAPWNVGRWDVDHKPYAEQFYRRYPNARAALNQPSKGGDDVTK